MRVSIFTIDEREEESNEDDEEEEEQSEHIPIPTESDILLTDQNYFDLDERSVRENSFGGENLLRSLWVFKCVAHH